MEAGTGAADVVAELAHQASLTTEKPVSAARANVLEQNGTAHVSLHIEKPRKKKKRKRKLEEGVEQPTGVCSSMLLGMLVMMFLCWGPACVWVATHCVTLTEQNKALVFSCWVVLVMYMAAR